MPAQLRHDPLTGSHAVVVQLAGKPVPRVRRTFNEGTGECAFCRMASTSPVAGDSVHDGEEFRPVLASSERVFAVENRWAVFQPPSGHCADEVCGISEIVLTRDHHVCIEDTDTAAFQQMVALLYERVHVWRAQYSNVQAIVNVGAESGGSVAHLHGQVLGSDIGSPQCTPIGSICGACEDIRLARANALVFGEGRAVVAYVPWSPSSNLELRVSMQACGVSDLGSLADAVQRTLRRLDQSGMVWPYNVIFHFGLHTHAHILARVDSGVCYPREFGVVPISVDLARLAATLRA